MGCDIIESNFRNVLGCKGNSFKWFYSLQKGVMELLINSQTSTAHPLNFGNW